MVFAAQCSLLPATPFQYRSRSQLLKAGAPAGGCLLNHAAELCADRRFHVLQ